MRILDLFCGAGGASMGYHLAFPDAEIVGVDAARQPRYPFEFVQADALEYRLRGFDLVHASPPCQDFSTTRNLILPEFRREYPRLIREVRKRMHQDGVENYVIENVPGSISELLTPVRLCGAMFPGLRVYRHRYFETSFVVDEPDHPEHVGDLGDTHTYQNDMSRFVTVAGNTFSRDNARDAMGIDWMTVAELAEAVPPAYTEWIGNQFGNTWREDRGHSY